MIQPPECSSWQQQVLRAPGPNGFQMANSFVAVPWVAAVVETAVGKINAAFRAVARFPSNSGSAKPVRSWDWIWNGRQVHLTRWNETLVNPRLRISEADDRNGGKFFRVFRSSKEPKFISHARL